ncbi:hypothetical protein ABTQ05_21580, partial [Acinetobacter baumannii]
MKEEWLYLLAIRVIFFCVSYFFYFLGTRRRWNYQLILNLVVGVNVCLMALVCGIVPITNALPYFLLGSV